MIKILLLVEVRTNSRYVSSNLQALLYSTMKFWNVFSPRGKDRLSIVVAYCKINEVVMIMSLSLFVVRGTRKYESTRISYSSKEIFLLESYRISMWFYQL